MHQPWNKLSLSEQDASFCRLRPRVDCTTGAAYEDLVKHVDSGGVQQWASRECVSYEDEPSRSCVRADTCKSQLPKGGAFSFAYAGSALNTIGKVKSQIMLNGGVITSTAMSPAVFERFKAYSSTDAVFETTEDLPPSRGVMAPDVPYMHALFCYGWRDTPNGEGHWLCKNSWSERWGNNGTIKIAYGAAYVMQPDYTFALQFHQASTTTFTFTIITTSPTIAITCPTPTITIVITNTSTLTITCAKPWHGPAVAARCNAGVQGSVCGQE
ncbi:hypothetical protein OEZ85_002219 [Tetradesmus obliquus]|uniref:Peptidase C1A papain C-terminal domain-containing protein n=1 Tax=Tetradesmus obliquus TaxID=3088 RepID=A0ABY8U2B3_TETOB|nr:hypothetical protein OEZ85_002219 [Tetradesmus obliquus]